MKKIILVIFCFFTVNIFANVQEKIKENNLNLKIIELENKIEEMSIQQEERKEFYKNSLEEITKKYEEIEKDEKKYDDAKDYYKQTVDTVKTHFNFFGLIIPVVVTVLLAIVGTSWWQNSKKTQENLEKIESDISAQNETKKKLEEEISHQNQKMLELKEIVEKQNLKTGELERVIVEQKKELEESKYNTLIGFAINKKTNEERIAELEKISKKYAKDEVKLEDIYFRLAYYNENKKAQLEYYTKVIELNNKDEVSYNNRGATKFELGDKEGAIEDYNKVIELNPKNEVAYNNRAECHIFLKNHKKALEDLIKYLEISKNKNIALDVTKENYDSFITYIETVDKNESIIEIMRRFKEKKGIKII